MPYRVENIVRKGEIACSSNFSFSHNVFHSSISLVCQNAALCGNGLMDTTSHTTNYSILAVSTDPNRNHVQSTNVAQIMIFLLFG